MPLCYHERRKQLKDTPNWVKMAEKELYKLNVIKFSDPKLKDHLQSSGEQRLFEASFHPVWRAGYHLGQADLCTQNNLRRANLHGLILERVRREQREALNADLPENEQDNKQEQEQENEQDVGQQENDNNN